ncbi:hypothetical protein ACQKDD_13220 [Planococcus kocurii]|uniref:hypothetical protein n=1 Tax=Planococcus kocurii TaxID=1374 RepID=UPI003D03EE7D
MARPKKIKKEVVQKLEKGFKRGLTNREACLYADVRLSTFYDYCKEKEEFSERKELLKDLVKMRAKLNVTDSIQRGNIDLSLWYLERKAKDEFSLKKEIEHNSGLENRLDLSGLSVEELRKLINSDG